MSNNFGSTTVTIEIDLHFGHLNVQFLGCPADILLITLQYGLITRFHLQLYGFEQVICFRVAGLDNEKDIPTTKMIITKNFNWPITDMDNT